MSTGTKVRSKVTAQGLETGKVYEVVDRIERSLPFGTFVTLIVKDGDKRFQVVNSHLLMEEVQP